MRATVKTDLIEIHDVAMGMGAEEVVPPEHIWVGLRNQLEAEGLIYEGRTAPPAEPARWWTPFQRPAFAAAFLGLILVASTAISLRQNSQSSSQQQVALQQDISIVPSADSVFKEEMLTVGNDPMPGSQAEDATVTASIRRNLGIVDNFIAMCEKDVREQPDNELAREYLYGAYEQKAELLATATSRSMTGGVQ